LKGGKVKGGKVKGNKAKGGKVIRLKESAPFFR